MEAAGANILVHAGQNITGNVVVATACTAQFAIRNTSCVLQQKLLEDDFVYILTIFTLLQSNVLNLCTKTPFDPNLNVL